jgi:hypothetical protein
MRFEARELKNYSEPVVPEELRTGEKYFGVQYLDENMLVPVLEPKVFIGRNLVPEDENEFYFQDYGSYQCGIRFDEATNDDGAIFETGAEKHVFT